MTQQITVNKQRNQKIRSQLDKIRRNDRNALLISEYKPIGADLMGLSWIFAEDDDYGMGE